MFVLMTIVGFLLGSLPFSLWIGKYWLGSDLRQVGDSNPGATNVLRAGGKGAALIALLLDIGKGALPVAIAYFYLDIGDLSLIPVMLAPVAGHAFSPLLGGNGGKAVATTGGVWAGVTAWEGPSIGGALLGVCTVLFGANGWAVIAAIGGMIVYLLVAPAAWNPLVSRPDANVIAMAGLANLLLVIWKHRADLRQWPPVRLRLTK
jgi:acyl phosphate:glycerol-3-phosphate acyltransferase